MTSHARPITSLMTIRRILALYFEVLILVSPVLLIAQTGTTDSGYVLGPEDQLSIWALGAEELSARPVRIDLNGDTDLPLIGRVHGAGLTVGQFKLTLIKRLQEYVREPEVTVTVSEYRSQPISVLGAVNKPGVYHLRGPMNLVEVLSLAEGLRSDAGSTVRLTRQRSAGDLPLPGATLDPEQRFSSAELNIKAVIEGKESARNLSIRPHDVVTVSRGQTVFVI